MPVIMGNGAWRMRGERSPEDFASDKGLQIFTEKTLGKSAAAP